MSQQEQFPKDIPDNCDSMCGQNREQIVDYLDGELTDQARLEFEAHNAACPECAAFCASYQAVVDTAKELREPEQPIDVGVQNRLRAALNQRLGINLPYIA